MFESKFSDVPVTKTCKKESGTVGKREVVVIDTPDLFSPNISTEEREQEIRHCITLCSPGPHILLLVTPLGHHTVEDKEIAKGIQELFGAEARRHMLLLITRKEDLGDESLPAYVQNTEYLKELVQNCGDRYCAFNNKVDGEEQDSQVQGLLEDIELLMKQKGGQCYAEFNVSGRKQENTMDSKADISPKLPDTLERKSCVTGVKTHQKEPNLPDMLSLILVGRSGTGKSSTGNTIIGEHTFVAKLAGKSVTTTCQNKDRTWKEKTIIVVDTPSFDLTLASEDLLSKQGKEVVRSLCLSPGARVFILVIQLGRFTQEDEKSIRELKAVFGNEITEHMIVLFTRKEDLGTGTLENYIQTSDNQPLTTLIKQCGSRVCAFNNKESGLAQEEQVNELLEMVDKLVQSHGGQGYAFSYRPETYTRRIEDFRRKHLFKTRDKLVYEKNSFFL